MVSEVNFNRVLRSHFFNLAFFVVLDLGKGSIDSEPSFYTSANGVFFLRKHISGNYEWLGGCVFLFLNSQEVIRQTEILVAEERARLMLEVMKVVETARFRKVPLRLAIRYCAEEYIRYKSCHLSLPESELFRISSSEMRDLAIWNKRDDLECKRGDKGEEGVYKFISCEGVDMLFWFFILERVGCSFFKEIEKRSNPV